MTVSGRPLPPDAGAAPPRAGDATVPPFIISGVTIAHTLIIRAAPRRNKPGQSRSPQHQRAHNMRKGRVRRVQSTATASVCHKGCHWPFPVRSSRN